MTKDENFEQMNRIVEAVMIYYNYFIPVHGDGKTAAEFLGTRLPAWLSTLVSANREKELPFREAKMVEEDSSHFHGMLVSSIAQDIMDGGGTSARARVVTQIMEELSAASGRREELKKLEGDAHRRRSATEFEREAVSGNGQWLGSPDSEEQTAPGFVIPFVTIFRVEKKDRVRALLQTYRGNIAVHFFGKENTVELQKENEEDERTLVAYCHPVSSEEVQIGTRLGVIKLNRDHIELASIVEERHRALRDFVAKLVGQRNMHFVKKMRNATIDPDTGEPTTTEEVTAEDKAIAMLEERDPDQVLDEGLEACIMAGVVISSKNEESLRVSPIFAAQVLERYRAGSKGSSKAEVMRRAILDTTMSHVSSSDAAEGNRTYEAMAAVTAVFALLIDCAGQERAKQAEEILLRMVSLKPVSDNALPLLVSYLERVSEESAGTRRKN